MLQMRLQTANLHSVVAVFYAVKMVFVMTLPSIQQGLRKIASVYAPINMMVIINTVIISLIYQNIFLGADCSIDLCEGINCGNGICTGGDPVTCNCDDGYVDINAVCEKTCDLNPCKEMDYLFYKKFISYRLSRTSSGTKTNDSG